MGKICALRSQTPPLEPHQAARAWGPRLRSGASNPGMCVQETTRPCQKRRLKLQATDDADRVYLCVVCVCARVRPAFRRMMSWTKVALAAAAALAAVEHASAFAPIGAPGTGAATRCTPRRQRCSLLRCCLRYRLTGVFCADVAWQRCE
jgi:hypothetical protein